MNVAFIKFPFGEADSKLISPDEGVALFDIANTKTLAHINIIEDTEIAVNVADYLSVGSELTIIINSDGANEIEFTDGFIRKSETLALGMYTFSFIYDGIYFILVSTTSNLVEQAQ